MSGSRIAARLAVLLGGLGVLAVPAAVVAAQELSNLTLLRALYFGAAAAAALALLALLAGRRARLGAQRLVFADRAGPVRAGRFLAWLALYVAASSGVALGVYWVLRARH
jgi:hypothetical protein